MAEILEFMGTNLSQYLVVAMCTLVLSALRQAEVRHPNAMPIGRSLSSLVYMRSPRLVR